MADSWGREWGSWWGGGGGEQGEQTHPLFFYLSD